MVEKNLTDYRDSRKIGMITDVGQVRTIFTNLKSICNNMNFVIGKNGFYTQGLDACHICILELNLTLKNLGFLSDDATKYSNILSLNVLILPNRLKYRFNKRS